MGRRSHNQLSNGAPALSDDALALEFAQAQEDYIRLIPETGSWMVWNGVCWRPDRNTVRETIRRVCREAAAEADDRNVAMRLASAAKVTAVEALARSDSRLVARAERWDSDPWQLNTLAGIIDLQTGQLEAHDPQRSMTKLAGAVPGGAAPRWERFLRHITEADNDLAAYLQRVAGYCLTGSTREHTMFFLLGRGANGKSVFTSVLSALLGDYASTAATDLLTATHLARHPTELAHLQGQRLVLVPEVERRVRFAENRLKALTGGDQIAARFMRQDFFTYVPQFKLMVTGNQLPLLDGVDEAVRRRLQIIPFRKVVPMVERDPSLIDDLLHERDGILGWAIEGCREWFRQGLNPPAAVNELSRFYLDNQDAIGRFIADRCEVDASLSVGSTTLFKSWLKWAAEAGEQASSQRAFVQELQSRGHPPARSATQRLIRGLALREQGDLA